MTTMQAWLILDNCAVFVGFRVCIGALKSRGVIGASGPLSQPGQCMTSGHAGGLLGIGLTWCFIRRDPLHAGSILLRLRGQNCLDQAPTLLVRLPPPPNKKAHLGSPD